MECRGQKRPELVEELPADKRTCSSLQSRPSSSSTAPETLATPAVTVPVVEAQEADMETSSSASASQHSEDEEERDSPYDSDSDDMNDDHQYSSLQEYQRSRASGDGAKFNNLLSSLSNEAEPSGQLAALTELCELLSFTIEESVSAAFATKIAPCLVKLANHETNPDIMLLAIRALTYLCDVFPPSSSILVSHSAVPALCQRLMVIEFLDVAEQCLQALEKISRYHPVPCLESGAIMAVLGYVDFFSTTVQRTAVCTVVNICKKLPSECPSSVIEAIPRLCNLLQYEDQQLVELVVTCLIKIADRVKGSPEMLNELYNHGLIGHVTHLIDLNSRVTLSQPIYAGLIGVISKIAAGSVDAVRSLFELNIATILKGALSNSEFSGGIESRSMDKSCNQVEILKLLHELIPETTRDKKDVLSLSKERLLLEQSDTLQKFGMNIFPTLVQLVNSGADLNVCYGCLSIISRLVYYSNSESLLEILNGINIASFLAGLFMRNDHHVLSLALQISKIVLEKHSSILMQAFVKEGVLFAIDGLLLPQSCSQLTSPQLNSIERTKESGEEAIRCLCYAYRSSRLRSPKSKACKLDKESVHKTAELIKSKYFPVELCSSQGMVTVVLQDLRYASAAITDLLSICTSSEASAHIEDKLCHILHKVLRQLTGNEPISTFELIESGIVKALLSYLSNGLYLRKNHVSGDDVRQTYGVQKRFEAFARIALSSPDPASSCLTISLLVRKLQIALSTLETFPAIVGCTARQRGSYATVPSGRQTTYPCLRVHFVRGVEELYLNDYSTEVVTVDPFCQVFEIGHYLISKVCSEKVESEANALSSENASTKHLGDAACPAGKGVQLEHTVSESVCNASADMQGSTDVEMPTVDTKTNLTASGSTCHSGDEENSKKGQGQVSLSVKDASSKLVLYLDGGPLEYSSTLYQEILQRQMKSPHGQNIAKLWSTTYTLTYKRVADVEARSDIEQEIVLDNGASEEAFLFQQVVPNFSSIYMETLGSAVDPSSSLSDILNLLRSLERMNRFADHLLSYERLNAFAYGKADDLDTLKVPVPTLSQYEFVSSRLTEKLEQQMRDSSAMHIGAMPLWCNHLMLGCPFLFSFEARCKYFQLAAFGRLQVLPNTSHSDSNVSRDRRSSTGSPPRKKFQVCRDQILESASQMMELYARKNVVLEVEYIDEIGTGLGPTLEFYTLVSHDFQKAGLGMWRGDYMSPTKSYTQQARSSGLFPRPWSPKSSEINGTQFADVMKRFILLGQIVGKALRDGRVLDIPFSKSFYKLILRKELSICDIQTFDPELGRILLEFKALINRRKVLELGRMNDVTNGDCLGFRDSTIEDLCLDFTLPGYPDYILASGMDDGLMVTSSNLEEYISMVLDATLYSGIHRQVQAFKSGLNQVIPDKHLHLFTENELERLLCGERDSWVSYDLFDHIKLDHGYTASSPPIINLLEVISEFDYEQRRAFLQFVTGAPRLPPGGLAALYPKLTIVRKHSSTDSVDSDLPSVMTCTNYLKLPPYSSKAKMKEKLLYAISEGQGSFHLS